jgi:hypothetical protein
MSEKNYKQWMLVKTDVNNDGRHASFKKHDVFEALKKKLADLLLS